MFVSLLCNFFHKNAIRDWAILDSRVLVHPLALIKIDAPHFRCFVISLFVVDDHNKSVSFFLLDIV